MAILRVRREKRLNGRSAPITLRRAKMSKTGVTWSTRLQCFFAGIASLISVLMGLKALALNGPKFAAAVFFMLAIAFIAIILVFLDVHKRVWKKHRRVWKR